jgi:L-fuculose-phosphate aldolase
MHHTYRKVDVTKIVRQMLRRCIPDRSSSENPSAQAKLVFESPEARALKQEMIVVGRKLWNREYVDGNGGNISYRISPDYVLCTPTLCSKGDLTFEDLALVSLENELVLGARAQTSEILLHLEIYKAVPAARAVIHCHPPHATAYAITGLLPPGEIIPEQEVFVGPVAIAPYDTPGTKAFAETVLPYAHAHNTILLANHGVVCWADTLTHAEWCVEVIDTYCRTLILALQLGSPIRRIPKEKISPLLEIKKKLALPDSRLPSLDSQLETGIANRDHSLISTVVAGRTSEEHERAFESLVTRIADQVLKFSSGEEQ